MSFLTLVTLFILYSTQELSFYYNYFASFDLIFPKSLRYRPLKSLNKGKLITHEGQETSPLVCVFIWDFGVVRIQIIVKLLFSHITYKF